MNILESMKYTCKHKNTCFNLSELVKVHVTPANT